MRFVLRDKNRRIDRPRGVVQRDDEVEIVIERRYPAMGRAVLEQQHARQRSTLTPLTVADRLVLDARPASCSASRVTV
jgi:hypothetical protein